MGKKWIALILIGIASGLAAQRVYNTQGLTSSLAVLLIVSWVLFNLRGKGPLLGAMNSLFNPLHTALTAFVIGFAYYAIRGFSFQETLIWSIGLLIFGIIFSMLVFKYWNIGA